MKKEENLAGMGLVHTQINIKTSFEALPGKYV